MTSRVQTETRFKVTFFAVKHARRAGVPGFILLILESEEGELYKSPVYTVTCMFTRSQRAPELSALQVSYRFNLLLLFACDKMSGLSAIDRNAICTSFQRQILVITPQTYHYSFKVTPHCSCRTHACRCSRTGATLKGKVPL